MEKNNYFQAVKKKHPDACLKTCYEAVANGKDESQTEMHGYVIDNKYFVASKTMQVYETNQLVLVENIEDSLSD